MPGWTEDPTPRHWLPPSTARTVAPATPGKVGTSTVTAGQNNNTGAEGQEFQMVRWCRRKGSTQQAGTADPSHTQPTMINLTPASYVGAAAAATDFLQTRANPKPTHALLAITEVTVLHQGGHINSLTEQQIQAHPPDTCCSRQIMARLGIEHRLPEYIPGALPTELPSYRYQTGLPLLVTTLCEQIAHPTSSLRRKGWLHRVIWICKLFLS